MLQERLNPAPITENPHEAELLLSKAPEISLFAKLRQRFGRMLDWARDAKLNIALAAILVPAAVACGGGAKGEEGNTNVNIAPTSTEQPLATATKVPEATATPIPKAEVVLTGGQLTSLSESALMQIVSKPYSELAKYYEKGSGVTLSPKEREVLNLYESVQRASKMIEGFRNGDPEVNPTNFVNSLGATATFTARLYCQSPNPGLANLFYMIRDYAEQNVNKFVAEGKFPANAWPGIERIQYTPPCPILRQ